MEWQLYTDGSWSSEGTGGWAYILDRQNARSFHSGAEPMNDNNEAELIAVLRGLEAIHAQRKVFPAVQVHIFCDSHAVRISMKRALQGEKWGRRIRKDVQEQFNILVAALHPRFMQVHRNISIPEEHRRCDSMARRARLALEATLQRSIPHDFKGHGASDTLDACQSGGP